MQTKTRTFRSAAQAGFTLIELIVVIVIIGILAAVAVPKFQDLTTSAQTAANKAVAAELGAAAAVNFAKVKADGGTYTAPACTAINSASYMTTPATGFTIAGSGGSCTVVGSASPAGTAASFTIPQ